MNLEATLCTSIRLDAIYALEQLAVGNVAAWIHCCSFAGVLYRFVCILPLSREQLRIHRGMLMVGT